MSNLSSLITQTVGSSAGGVNLITAPSSASIWTATGGVTVTTTTTAAELPLEGFSSTAVKFALSASTGTAYCDFDCPTALQNFLLQLLWYSRSSSAFTASITLSINSYSSSGNRTSNTSPTVVTPQVSAIIGAGINFETNFNSTANQYLRLTLSFGAQASAWYSIAQFSIGPSNRTQGPAFTDPIAVTFTGTWVTNTTYTAFETRIGSLARYDIKIALTGAPTAATLVLTLPSGRTIDTTKLANTGATAGNILPNSSVGITDISTESYAGGVHYNSSTSVGILWTDDNAVATKFFGVTATAPMSFASGDTISISFIVPIAEWASSALNSGQGAQVEYAYNNSGATTGFNNAAFAYGPVGAAIGSITANTRFGVKFQYPVRDGDEITLEIWEGVAGSPWKQVGPTMRGGVDINFHYQNGTDYGMGISTDRTAPSDITVTFGQYAYNTSTYGAAGTSWAAAGLNTAYWRVKKATPSAPVGFGLANIDGSSGLYMAGRAPGLATGAAVSTGYIGEKVAGTGYTTALSNGARVKAADIVLNKGVWLVFMNIGGSTVTSLTGTRTYAEIASSTAGVIVYSRADGPTVATSVADITFPLCGYVVISADATTVYGNVVCLFSAGSGLVNASSIYAIRLA
jgi:hypothetical protein